MNIKEIVKGVLKVLCGPVTKLQFMLTKEQSTISHNEAIINLNNVRENRPCIIEGNNTLAIEYDLMIVVPAYNAEKYINECVDSLLNQTTTYTYQIVVVDDGSTDNTGEILDEYKSNSKVRVIHQENGGISNARNASLKTITGKYIMFVDSDDVLCPDSIQKLLDKAYSLNADIIEGNYYAFNSSGQTIYGSQYDDTDIDSDFFDHNGFPWGKVFKTELFEHLMYPSGFEYEDSIIVYCVFPAAEKKYTISHNVYRYRDNPNGITHTGISSPKCIDTYYVSFRLWQYYHKRYAMTESFNKLILFQIFLNYGRTKQFGEQILESGFCLTREIYLEMFPDKFSITNKYALLDRSIRENDFGKYKLLCDRWNYLK